MLLQGFKVHQSRLEQEVESAKRRERSNASPLPSYMRPTANSAGRVRCRSCWTQATPDRGLRGPDASRENRRCSVAMHHYAATHRKIPQREERSRRSAVQHTLARPQVMRS